MAMAPEALSIFDMRRAAYGFAPRGSKSKVPDELTPLTISVQSAKSDD
jgi:hypothetical protein